MEECFSGRGVQRKKRRSWLEVRCPDDFLQSGLSLGPEVKLNRGPKVKTAECGCGVSKEEAD